MFYAMLSRKRRYVKKIVQRLKLTAIKLTIPINSTKSQEMLRVFKSIRLGNHAKQRYSKCDLDSRQPQNILIAYHAWMPLVGSIVKSCPADRAVCVVGVGPVAEQQLAHLNISQFQFCQKRKAMYLYFNKSLFCSKEKPSVAIAVRLIDILTILKPGLNLATKKIISQVWIPCPNQINKS